jgi:hypothetical protein
MAAGIAVLAALALLVVLLLPPYFENWKLQQYLNDLAADPTPKSPEIIQSNVVNKAAQLGLPVRTDDVHVVKSGDALKVEVLYIVPINLGLYSVDLHFRPAS